MSFAFARVPHWALEFDLSKSAWQTYVALLTFAASNQCHPTQAVLADRAKLSVPTVKRALAELEGNGMLTISRTGRSSTYELSTNRPELSDSSSGELSHTSKEVNKTKEQDHPQTPTSDPLFEEFWTTYPRRVAKGGARTSWLRAVAKGVDPQEMILGAKRYSEFVNGKDPKYVKHPQTWINQECWTDELVTSSRGMHGQIANADSDDWMATEF